MSVFFQLYPRRMHVARFHLGQKKLEIFTDCSISSAAIETHLVSYDGFVLVQESHIYLRASVSML